MQECGLFLSQGLTPQRANFISFSCIKKPYKVNVDSLGTTVEVEVNLRPTVSRPVCLGVGLTSGAHDQILVFCLDSCGFF
jgi:hypothetical protein